MNGQVLDGPGSVSGQPEGKINIISLGAIFPGRLLRRECGFRDVGQIFAEEIVVLVILFLSEAAPGSLLLVDGTGVEVIQELGGADPRLEKKTEEIISGRIEIRKKRFEAIEFNFK